MQLNFLRQDFKGQANFVLFFSTALQPIGVGLHWLAIPNQSLWKDWGSLLMLSTPVVQRLSKSSPGPSDWPCCDFSYILTLVCVLILIILSNNKRKQIIICQRVHSLVSNIYYLFFLAQHIRSSHWHEYPEAGTGPSYDVTKFTNMSTTSGRLLLLQLLYLVHCIYSQVWNGWDFYNDRFSVGFVSSKST